MTKHTPGPWRVRESIKGFYIVRGDGSIGDSALCKVLNINGRGRSLERARETAANARLIAAAPKMGDFIAAAVARLTVSGRHVSEESLRDMAQEARAILALIADGEEHPRCAYHVENGKRRCVRDHGHDGPHEWGPWIIGPALQ